MDLFERQWDAYRSVVDNDWMEHRGVTAACAQALESWMTVHPERNGTTRLLDLGCGDLARMAPVFRALPLKSYVGVDITERVLPLAREEMGPVSFQTEFHLADVTEFVEAGSPDFDVVHASFVLHHLSDEDKAIFLSSLRRRVRPDGIFLWADVFREPGEDRSDYVDRYAARIRAGWLNLGADARESIVTHMSTYDFPADRAAIEGAAKRAGWRWEWIWNGHHRAEAVALLTPA